MALDAEIASKEKEFVDLRAHLKEKEDAFRAFATKTCGMKKEQIDAKIKQAYSAHQKPERLQHIYKAHKAMVNKREEVEALQARVNAARKAPGERALVKGRNNVRMWIQEFRDEEVRDE